MVHVKSAHRGVEMLHNACSRLRRRDQLAAIPWGESQLIVLGKDCPPLAPISGKDWHAEFDVAARHNLHLSSPDDLSAAAQLVHKVMTMMFELSGSYWRSWDSARIWHPHAPEVTKLGISLYKKFSFASLGIPSVGVSVSIDVRHRLLSEHNVDYYIDQAVKPAEAHRRWAEFDRLRQRSEGRKGTLIYDSGHNYSTCYFASFEPGMTCQSSGPLQVNGQYYPSLFDYYRKKRPQLKILPNDSAVYVSFRGLGTQPVAAKNLRISIHLDNDVTPLSVRRKMTIPPHAREKFTTRVWDSLPVGRMRKFELSLAPSYWAPMPDRTFELNTPDLVFAQKTLRAPRERSAAAIRDHYRRRRSSLRTNGFLHLEDVGSRQVTLVMPAVSKHWPEDLSQKFAKDLKLTIESLSRREYNFKIVRASTTEDIIEKIGRHANGFALIVFDATHRGAYALLSHELKNWRKKRFTRQKLTQAWRAKQEANSDFSQRRTSQRWQDMIFHSAIDVLCLMGGTPWRLTAAPYDACLAIDVSDNRRHFGLTLIVNRPDDQFPGFLRVSRVWHKGDHQHETINAEVLTDKISGLPSELANALGGFDPLNSLMVLRDGNLCDGELEAIQAAFESWDERGYLTPDASIDIGAFLKSTEKGLRMWRRRDRERTNVLEGQGLLLSDRTGILCCTGSATLSRYSTAEPVVIQAADDTMDVRRLIEGSFAYAQLNFSSPAKPSREPLPIRELDAALAERVVQDTRGIQ